MRVLVLGMCRTGTSSMMAALGQLGYNAHHMRCVMGDPSQVPLWQEATQLNLLPESDRPAHLRGAKPYGKEEFDRLLSEHDAVTDLPAALFYRDLLQAYPDAKVILTNRSFESWQRSMSNTIWKLLQWRAMILVAKLRLGYWGRFCQMLHYIFKAHNGGNHEADKTKEPFERHYANVRALVPKDNLLEFGPKFEWGPLCEFLGHDVPDTPYPWINEGPALEKEVFNAWKVSMMDLAKVVLVPTGIAAAGLAAWYYQMPLTNKLQRLW
jgi:hypothetical protein